MEDLFPSKEGVDYSTLEMTEEGLYSITRRRDAQRIITILRTSFKNIEMMSITDATGCVGGDTINLALHFKEVYSIEKNNENFEALSHNIKVFGLKNVTLYNADSIDIFDWYSDVLYVDPPWGGKDYKSGKDIDLYMSEKRIDVWLEEVLKRKNRPCYIVLKLPANYNFQRLNELTNVEDIHAYSIRKYYLVCVDVHKH
jgi:predicted RNA methylase